MREACSTYGVNERCIQDLGGETQAQKVEMILKCIFKN